MTVDSHSDALFCIPTTGMQDQESPSPSYADGSERNLAIPFKRGGDSLADRKPPRLSSAALLSTPPGKAPVHESGS